MISVDNISVTLGRGAPLIRNVNLEVANGEWVTVIGPNGAGKSTLLHAINQHLPYSGTIQIDHRDTRTLSRRERAQLIATVPQSPTVPPGMAVGDYVLLGRTPYISPLRSETAHDVAIADDVMTVLDLQRFRNRVLSTLSGGERQRVFLARALAQQAPVLLLDEPTTALDIGHQQEVLDLVDELRIARGITVLSTMHDLSIAAEYAERMALIADGTFVAMGTPTEVLTTGNLSQFYGAHVQVYTHAGTPAVIPIRRRRR
ncbi:ABC transporter ATP-binding protein [Hoyosella rhizosphaerae]|uniref:Cobalamin/Fe3+-siderophore ABC transporter ATP-binding protein n=1 Tax=Hoyosella rhizosphaerae TaxID=1755582 RepID=A0A916UE53_9ACTN|nr:ABC transporter ATP-binding protein [Hoyosella rhizosphaerae]MBN4925707.1 ABC transporter ATP-binding protein [Hoyosella rhizosphaerae]GGC68582.1 cobalamin/Fe3+-siderophore ABC transporter ATP-binding protein [Hoyosella rhizosphaerae]